MLLALFVILSGTVLPAERSLASPLFDSAPSFAVNRSFTNAMDDWNHDGNADVAFFYSDHDLAVYRSNGDGTFSTGVVYATGPVDQVRSAKILSADVNGDGNPDLLTGNTGSVSILLGNGDGTFATHADYPSGGSGVAVADVNGDGKLDVATTTSVLLGNGDGTFSGTRFVNTLQSSFGIASGDFRRNGLADLATANANNGISVLLSNSNGTFQPPANYNANYNTYLVVADFNGDQWPDLLAVGDFGAGTMSLLLNNGDGTFASARAVSITGSLGGVVATDFNNDGKMDLAVVNTSNKSISVLLGNGDGTFQSAVTYAAGSRPNSVTSGDFNGDGKLDLAVANSNLGPPPARDSVSVLLGNGDGTFQAPVSYGAGTAPGSVTSGDFNGDGKPDLVVVNSNSNTVSVLLGNGDGTFQAPISYLAGASPSSVTSGDFNGDGKPDLVVANYNSSTVSVLLGNGDGTFQAAASYDVAGAFAASVTSGDLNGDGRLDLAVANGSTVSVLLGNGDGTFQGAVNYATGPGPSSVTGADFNRDGKLDLVTVNRPHNDVSILLNAGCLP